MRLQEELEKAEKRLIKHIALQDNDDLTLAFLSYQTLREEHNNSKQGNKYIDIQGRRFVLKEDHLKPVTRTNILK